MTPRAGFTYALDDSGQHAAARQHRHVGRAAEQRHRRVQQSQLRGRLCRLPVESTRTATALPSRTRSRSRREPDHVRRRLQSQLRRLPVSSANILDPNLKAPLTTAMTLGDRPRADAESRPSRWRTRGTGRRATPTIRGIGVGPGRLRARRHRDDPGRAAGSRRSRAAARYIDPGLPADSGGGRGRRQRPHPHQLRGLLDPLQRARVHADQAAREPLDGALRDVLQRRDAALRRCQPGGRVRQPDRRSTATSTRCRSAHSCRRRAPSSPAARCISCRAAAARAKCSSTASG